MKLREPQLSPPKVEPVRDANIITETRKYRLITPLFGGGVKAGEADPITLIRGASVRGQLRFWWRATRGGQFNGDLDAMRKAEQAIWGSAAKKGDETTGPSKVNVAVKILRETQDDRPFEIVRNPNDGKPKIQSRPGSSAHPYVAFPLQPKQEEATIEMQTAAVKSAGIEFWLEISYPKDFEKDVAAALWAWETFGGVGGRTRRGFGTITLYEHTVNKHKKQVTTLSGTKIVDEIGKQLQNFVSQGTWPKGIFHLTQKLRLEIDPKIESSGEKAWQSLITKYHNFRQLNARRDKKTQKKSKYGASVWPEAESLRSLKNKKKNGAIINKFPRAAFGLPILYHLPHDDGITFTLQGNKVEPNSEKSYERLASRLILKPLACANGQYVGLAAVLVGPSEPPTGLQIIERNLVVKANLSSVEAKSEPLNQILHGETDVIEAFLKTLK